MGHRPTEARFFSRLEERIARIFHPGDPHPLAILHSLLFRLSNQSSTTGFQVWCIKEHDRMSSFRRRVKGRPEASLPLSSKSFSYRYRTTTSWDSAHRYVCCLTTDATHILGDALTKSFSKSPKVFVVVRSAPYVHSHQ